VAGRSDALIGGSGPDRLYGGVDNDTLDTRDGYEVIDCDSGGEVNEGWSLPRSDYSIK
jgi:hemolysin type calcium-binding protein